MRKGPHLRPPLLSNWALCQPLLLVWQFRHSQGGQVEHKRGPSDLTRRRGLMTVFSPVAALIRYTVMVRVGAVSSAMAA